MSQTSNSPNSLREKFFQYGKYPTSHDIVKALAILSMVIDHVGLFVYGDNTWFRIVGRMAGPLFFFAIGHSMNTTVTWRLFLWGLFLTVLSAVTLQSSHLNILLSFLLCRLLFQYWKPEESSKTVLCLVLLCMFPLSFLSSTIFEYGTVGVAWAIAGRLVRAGSAEKTLWVFGGSCLNFMWAGIHFDVFLSYQQTSLLLGECFFLLSLIEFQKQEFRLPRILGYPMMAFSRFSLDIYVYHLSGFLLFALLFMG